MTEEQDDYIWQEPEPEPESRGNQRLRELWADSADAPHSREIFYRAALEAEVLELYGRLDALLAEAEKAEKRLVYCDDPCIHEDGCTVWPSNSEKRCDGKEIFFLQAAIAKARGQVEGAA